VELPFPIRNRRRTIESGNQEIRKGKKHESLLFSVRMRADRENNMELRKSGK
jgi:hypothetical protein